MQTYQKTTSQAPIHIISYVKDYFSQSGYVVDNPTGRGVESDFRIKKGQTKRDPVSIIDVKEEFTDIKISQITNEKRYVFRVQGMYFITTGRTLEKNLNNRLISIEQIKKFKRISVTESISSSGFISNPVQTGRMDLVYSLQIYNIDSVIDLNMPVLSIVAEVPQTCFSCQPPME